MNCGKTVVALSPRFSYRLRRGSFSLWVFVPPVLLSLRGPDLAASFDFARSEALCPQGVLDRIEAPPHPFVFRSIHCLALNSPPSLTTQSLMSFVPLAISDSRLRVKLQMFRLNFLFLLPFLNYFSKSPLLPHLKQCHLAFLSDSRFSRAFCSLFSYPSSSSRGMSISF